MNTAVLDASSAVTDEPDNPTLSIEDLFKGFVPPGVGLYEIDELVANEYGPIFVLDLSLVL